MAPVYHMYLTSDTMLNLRLFPRPLCAVTFWWGEGGIEYLNVPDSYADWSFYTPGRASQVRQG